MTETPSDLDADPMTRRMVMEDPMAWLECFPKIKNKKDQIVSVVANVLQQRIGEGVRYCRKHGIPIRFVIPKPRQKGISTGTVGCLQWHQKIKSRSALIVGGKDWQVDNLWSIYKRYAETDSFPWGFDGHVGGERADFGNGSQLLRQTAGGDAAGRSATFQDMVGTEVAYWGHDKKVKNASGVLAGLLAGIPSETDDPDTMVFLESTSAGGSGLFYRMFERSISVERLMAGERSSSGWYYIFAGVFEFEESYIAPKDAQEEADILAGLGARNEAERLRERELRHTHHLNAGQIKYWRWLLESQCDNDPAKRDMDYPPTVEDAFRAAARCRFNMGSLKLMRDQARQYQDKLEWGYLDQPNKDDASRFVWTLTPDHDEASMVLAEHPRDGLRYLISTDNMTGKVSGDDRSDPDCHAVTVFREGYFDAHTKNWVPRAIVAAIKPKCRVGIDILADWVWRLHVYYGRCLVVPEGNNDSGLILLLRQRGCLLYEKQRPASETQSHKPSGKIGFYTEGGVNEGSRRWIIENLDSLLRNMDRPGQGLFCPFLWILDEMEHFATDPDTGRAEAMNGWHDDWVMATCIGNGTINGASMYHWSTYASPDPPEVVYEEQRMGRQTPGGDRV